ncbi:hypothetical protein [Myxococcus landrumensis]|uniref:Lipoprotein n=1 Tax=Myxococcus landrumensis TaxID=2813577 RepID=A0ABX7NED8_9BACT|nr:hypothetical protein [Myxococcus landrumus]QSQ17150.1 hypothetical protein JY572_14280 [Myxococcus landrumus]
MTGGPVDGNTRMIRVCTRWVGLVCALGALPAFADGGLNGLVTIFELGTFGVLLFIGLICALLTRSTGVGLMLCFVQAALVFIAFNCWRFFTQDPSGSMVSNVGIFGMVGFAALGWYRFITKRTPAPEQGSSR